MTMHVRAHKPAVGGYGATPQPAPVGYEAKTPKAGKLEQQPDAISAKYNADGFDGAKHCKGGHAAEGKKQGGHKKDQPGGVTPPTGGTPPPQGAYPTTPPTGGTPPTQGTPPVGDPAVGTPEQGILKAVQEIASTVEKLIEALGGQVPEKQVPDAPAGNTGIVPPGAVQGAPAQNTGFAGTPPVSATPYPV